MLLVVAFLKRNECTMPLDQGGSSGGTGGGDDEGRESVPRAETRNEAPRGPEWLFVEWGTTPLR